MDDVDYFAARERAERSLANKASNAKVRDIHLALAEQYSTLAGGEVERADNENDFLTEPNTQVNAGNGS